MNYGLIFAGGTGKRMGNSLPKQFLEVDQKPIIIHTLEVFEKEKEIDGMVVVCIKEYIPYCQELIRKFNVRKVLDVIPGGKTGQESIFLGLQYLYKKISQTPQTDIVLIHDGVRPLIEGALIRANIACVRKYGNCISVAQAIETIITMDEQDQIEAAIDRAKCRYAKAPQSFRLDEIYAAHLRAKWEGRNHVIDSATMMSGYGYKLHTTECSSENIKITTPVDYYMFCAIYKAKLKERGKQ